MIIIFGKEYCPYCLNSKKVLNEKKYEYAYFPLEEVNNQNVVEKLKELELIPYSHNTVPIVINYKDRKPKFIGGNDDLMNFLE